MLRRARKLVETRGEREIRLDKAHELPFLSFKTDRLSLAIDSTTDKLQIAIKSKGLFGARLIYYEDPWRLQDSIYKPGRYQEAVEIMRKAMLLEDIADV